MLTINIGWEYFLGFIGTLIVLAYYANGRFTRLEANFDWLAQAVRDLTIKADNYSARAFDASSPVSLTATGEQLLRDSGLKSYVDRRRDELTTLLQVEAPFDPYTIQERAFRLFDSIPFDEAFGRHLNKFAFRVGTSTGLLRRIAAIYLRDVATNPH